MKRFLLAGVLTIGALALAGGPPAGAADDPPPSKPSTTVGQSFVDADGDGVCDNCTGVGQGRGQGRGQVVPREEPVIMVVHRERRGDLAQVVGAVDVAAAAAQGAGVRFDSRVAGIHHLDDHGIPETDPSACNHRLQAPSLR